MLPSHDFLENQNCVARALYDNIAESPDELAFRKGDLLTVLEQNTGGIEGWWLCSLRGRQGICPGNRLKLLAGVYESGDTDFQIPNYSKRRSWHIQSNMVMTPQKFGDVYLYQAGDTQDRYDIPNSQEVFSYDIPRALSREGSESVLSSARSKTPTSPPPVLDQPGQCYDIPRPIMAAPLTPSSSASSLTASLSSSNRSSLVPEYDIPKPRTVNMSQFYDIPAPNPKPKELPLELHSALESLNRLQDETSNAVMKLLGLVTPTWRRPEQLQNGTLDIKLTALRLGTALHELSEFFEGSLGNAHRAADKNLVTKLRPLAKALNDADRIIQDSCNNLDHLNWSVEALARDSEDTTPDSLDRLIACARNLTEDVRRAASFLHGNASLLFKKEAHDDYDYVNLEKEAQANKDILECLPPELKKSFDVLVKDAENMSLSNNNLNENINDDNSLVCFYAGLAVTHTANITKAIDAFLQTVEHNQPPKVFLAHGKFVVLSAHQLVRIGDIVARNISQTNLKSRIQERSDGLAEALSQTVHRTKRAAQHFPSVSAVQDMVDSVVDVSHMARDLKMSLVTAIQQ